MINQNQKYYTSDAQIEDMYKELEHAHSIDMSKQTRYTKKKIIKICANLFGILLIIFLVKTWIQVEDAKSKGEVPTVLGYQIYEVKTGSMVPTIPVKSLILSRVPSNASTLEEGDVVTFQDEGKTITHRIVEVNHDGDKVTYRTKGDNPNNSIDPNILTPDRIQAVYVMKLPFRFTSESD